MIDLEFSTVTCPAGGTALTVLARDCGARASGGAHNNLQPYAAVYKIIKT